MKKALCLLGLVLCGPLAEAAETPQVTLTGLQEAANEKEFGKDPAEKRQLTSRPEERFNEFVYSLEVVSRDKKMPITPVTVSLSPVAATNVYLEVGDSLDNQLLRLQARKGVKAEFKLEQSFETSVTIMAEGPHVDLLEWKHYTSPWQPLKKLNATEFITRRISDEETQKFPEVTPEEIRQAVIKYAGVEWTNRLNNIKGPTDEPAAVGVSTIRVRILMKQGDEWKVIHTVNFLVPMGC